jgi:hypothetical protein
MIVHTFSKFRRKKQKVHFKNNQLFIHIKRERDKYLQILNSFLYSKIYESRKKNRLISNCFEIM